jgi:hypothetical protein
MSLTRQSAGCSPNPTVVKQCMNESIEKLERVTKLFLKHNASCDFEESDSIKERILSLSCELARVKNLGECTAEVCGLLNNEVRISGDVPITSTTIRDKIRKKTEIFDPMKDFEVKRINRVLYPKTSSSDSDSDNDCELLHAPFSLADTICPFTMLTFEHPMRRYL